MLVAYTLASFAHTQQVLVGLLDLGVLIPVADRIGMIAGDWVGLYLYLVVVAIGLLIGFSVMALIRRVLPVPRTLLYALAGALAMLAILSSMRELASMTPIAGARGILGMSLQCLAGAIGGAVFGISLDRFGRTDRHHSGRYGTAQ